MKEKELRKHAICSLCRQKILAGSIPVQGATRRSVNFCTLRPYCRLR